MKSLPLQLLDNDALSFRLERIFRLMKSEGMNSMLVSDNINKFYLTGRIFDGYIYLSRPDASIRYFVRRPTELTGQDVYIIRKVEDIPGIFERGGIALTLPMGLETTQSSWASVTRTAGAFGLEEFGNADAVLMQARAVKAPDEIRLIRACGEKHDRVYRRIPHLFQDGMTDIELQVEIERLTRLEGGIGIMRVNGDDMEINMGSVLTGRNADTPSPYDFALGGAGTSPALPVGADGSVIKPGCTVMVDTNGDFNGYMTDMTRTFTLGSIPAEAVRAHEVSIDICRRLEKEGRAGVACATLYDMAMQMAADAGLANRFMGHTRQAGFIGHGVGITINELPVLSPRSKSILEENNIIAIEPKFVFEHTGAVGIENTYRVTATGLECLTVTDESLVSLGI
ncbi:MAG: Xaa-Pro peptidase family protein [Bacteroidales bacterium]|nr:Xaa-Pro peptidase family protein [Bacteroidales bacterium]